MNVADRFDGKFVKMTNFASSALYLLASPSTPDSAIDEAIHQAEEGQRITHAMAQKIIAAEKACP